MSHEFEEISAKVIEAAIDVHKALGPGYLESIYESALRIALRRRAIDFRFQEAIDIVYEEEIVGVHRPDLIVDGALLVELKAVKALDDIHFAQVKSYLKATKLHVGLLLNFNAPTLVVKRIVL
jgi:GxxExxY protein